MSVLTEEQLQNVTQNLTKLETRARRLNENQKRWGSWWRGVYMYLGLPAALLAAAAGVTGLVDSADLSVVLAFLAAAISAILAFSQADQRAAQAESLEIQCEAFANRVETERTFLSKETDDASARTLCEGLTKEWEAIRMHGGKEG